MDNKKSIFSTNATYIRTTDEMPVFVGFHFGYNPYAIEHKSGISGLETLFGIKLDPKSINTEGYVCEKAELVPTDIILIEQNSWPNENITTLLLGGTQRYTELNNNFNLTFIGIDLGKDLAASWSSNEFGIAAKGDVMQNRLRDLHKAILDKDVFVGYQKIEAEIISPVILFHSKLMEFFKKS